MSRGTIKERLVESVFSGAGGYFGALGPDWILGVTVGFDLSGEVFWGVLRSIFGNTLAEFLLPLMGIPIGFAASSRQIRRVFVSFVMEVWTVVVWVLGLALIVTPVVLLARALLSLPAAAHQVVVVIASSVFVLLLVRGLLAAFRMALPFYLLIFHIICILVRSVI